MTLIHGVQTNGDLTALLVDATGRPLVVIDAITGGSIPVVTQNPVVVQSTTSDKLLGYSAALGTVAASGNHAAGAVSVSSTVVPAGEVWFIDNIQAENFSSAVATTMRFQISDGVVTDLIVNNLVANTRWNWINGGMKIVLNPGGAIVAVFSNSNLNDNCQIRIHGYRSHTT